jgi:hypothetical protein
MLRRMSVIREDREVRHQEPESHQRNARADPGEKRSLFGQVIPQISHSFFLS